MRESGEAKGVMLTGILSRGKKNQMSQELPV